jgi:hypothetical protein
MELWFFLSEESKNNLARIYKELTGKDFIPPDKEKRAIRCDTKIEDLKEIDRLMRQKPSGRMGRGSS